MYLENRNNVKISHFQNLACLTSHLGRVTRVKVIEYYVSLWIFSALHPDPRSLGIVRLLETKSL